MTRDSFIIMAFCFACMVLMAFYSHYTMRLVIGNQGAGEALKVMVGR